MNLNRLMPEYRLDATEVKPGFTPTFGYQHIIRTRLMQDCQTVHDVQHRVNTSLNPSNFNVIHILANLPATNFSDMLARLI